MKKCVTFICFVLLRNVGGGTASSSSSRGQQPPQGRIWHPFHIFHTRKKRLMDGPCRCHVWTWNRACCDIRGGNNDVPPPPPPPPPTTKEDNVDVSLSRDECKRDVVPQKNVGLSDDNGVVSSEWDLPPPPPPSLFSIPVSSQPLEVNNEIGNASADTSNFAEQQVISDADSGDLDIPPPPLPSLSSISSQPLEVNDEIGSSSGNAVEVDTSNFAEQQVIGDADSRDLDIPPPPPSTSCRPLEVGNDMGIAGSNVVEVDKSPFEEQNVFSEDADSLEMRLPPPPPPLPSKLSRPLGDEDKAGTACVYEAEANNISFPGESILCKEERDTDASQLGLPLSPPFLPKHSQKLDDVQSQKKLKDDSIEGGTVDISTERASCEEEQEKVFFNTQFNVPQSPPFFGKSPTLEDNDNQNVFPDLTAAAESQSFDADLSIEGDEKVVEKKAKRNDEDSRKYDIPPPPPPPPSLGQLHNLDLQGNEINACDEESKQGSTVDDVETPGKYLSPPPSSFSSIPDGKQVRVDTKESTSANIAILSPPHLTGMDYETPLDKIHCGEIPSNDNERPDALNESPINFDISSSPPSQSVEEKIGSSSQFDPVPELNVMPDEFSQRDDTTTDVLNSNENGIESGYAMENEIVGNQSISSSFVSDPGPKLSNEIIKQSNVKLCERCPLRNDCNASIPSSQDSHQVEAENNVEEALPYLSSLANIDRDLDEDEFDRLIMEITGDESLNEINSFENEYCNDENVEGNAEELIAIDEISNLVLLDSLSSSKVEEVSDGSNSESDYVTDKGYEVELNDVAKSEINVDTNEISDDEISPYDVGSGLDEDIDAFTDQSYPELLSKEVEGEFGRVPIDDLSYSEIFSDEEMSSDLDADEILALDEATLTLDTNCYDENYDFDNSGDNFLLEEDSSYDSLDEYDLQVLEHSSLLLNNDASDCDDNLLLQYDYEEDDTYSDMESDYTLDNEKESTSEIEELEERIILDLGDSAVDNNVGSDELDEHWAAHHGVPSRKQQLFEEEQRKLFEEQARVHAAMAQHQQQTGHASIGWNIQPPPPPPNSSQSSAHLGISRSSLHIRTGESGTTIVRRQHFNINIPASSAMDVDETISDDKHNDVDKMNDPENLHQTGNQGDPYLQPPQYFEGQKYQSQEYYGDSNEQRNQQPPPPPPQS